MLAATIAEQPLHRRIIRLPEVVRRTSLSKSTIYARMKKGQFPPQAKPLPGSQTARWYEDEIDAYIESSRTARPESEVRIANVASESTHSTGLPMVASRWVSPPKKEMAKPGRPLKSKARLASNESGLMVTGMKIAGYDEVYLQTATGRLFAEIGRVSEDLLSLIVAQQTTDRDTAGSE